MPTTETTQPTVGKSYRVAIHTRYIAPTTHRGTRVKVWHGDSKALYIDWAHELNPEDNHAKAVQAYLDKMEWVGHWVLGALADSSGYVAVWTGDSE